MANDIYGDVITVVTLTAVRKDEVAAAMTTAIATANKHISSYSQTLSFHITLRHFPTHKRVDRGSVV